MATLQSDGWVKPDDPRDAWMRQTGDDRFEMRFVRDVPRPPERVWAALTTPEHIAEWLGTPIQIDSHVGGKFIVAFPHGGEDLVETTIVACDPPRLFVMEWGDALVRWEITPTAGGCRLVFSQDGLNAWWFLGNAAGWMGMVDDIASIACGGGAKEIEGGYLAAVERYKQEFGRFVPNHTVRPTLYNGEPRAFVLPAGVGRYDLRYVRRYMLPRERLWAALTEPARLADWLGVAKIDLRVGGEVEIAWPTQGAGARYVIRELEAPTLMIWGSVHDPDAFARWRLVQEDPGFMGTRVMLTEAGTPANDLLSVATGWHAHLRDLGAAAQRETPLAWSVERERARVACEMAEIAPGYRERLARDAPDAV